MPHYDIESVGQPMKVEKSPGDLGIQDLAKLVCAERLHQLEEKTKEEVLQIKGRQARMRFLNNAIRTVNAAQADKNGDLDLEKIVDLKQLKEDAKNMEMEAVYQETEAEKLETEAKELLESHHEESAAQMKKDAAKKQKQAQAKRDEAAELRDIGKAMEILSGKTKLSKEDKGKLIDNCRSCFDDLNNINQLQIQSSNRLNNERHETLLMARMIMKSLHEDIVHKARAAAGRS